MGGPVPFGGAASADKITENVLAVIFFNVADHGFEHFHLIAQRIFRCKRSAVGDGAEFARIVIIFLAVLRMIFVIPFGNGGKNVNHDLRIRNSSQLLFEDLIDITVIVFIFADPETGNAQITAVLQFYICGGKISITSHALRGLDISWYPGNDNQRKLRSVIDEKTDFSVGNFLFNFDNRFDCGRIGFEFLFIFRCDFKFHLVFRIKRTDIRIKIRQTLPQRNFFLRVERAFFFVKLPYFRILKHAVIKAQTVDQKIGGTVIAFAAVNFICADQSGISVDFESLFRLAFQVNR